VAGVSTVRVVVVDDDPLVRAGLRMILGGAPDLDVVGEAVDGQDAMDVIARELPDVVLMDIRMPRMDGLAATRRLKERGTTARIMSLRDGKVKMSKSDPSEMSRIQLTDSDDAISQKVRKAKTDPEPLPDNVEGLESRPEAKNLVGIYAAVTGQDMQQVLHRFEGQGFGQFKPALAEVLVELIAPIRARLDELRRDPGDLDRILDAGARRASELAAPTLAQAKVAVGLGN